MGDPWDGNVEYLELYQCHYPNFDFVSLFSKMLSLGKTGERGQRISLYFFIQLAASESTIL